MNELWTAEVQQRMRVLQIAYAAMVGGALVFAGIASIVPVAIADQTPGDPAAVPVDVTILRYVWLAVFAFALIALYCIRNVMPKHANTEFARFGHQPAGPFGPYFIMTMLTAAVMEGASVLGSIILLLGDQRADLALGLLPLVIMLPFFPTRGGFLRFGGANDGPDDSGRGLTAPSRDYRKYN